MANPPIANEQWGFFSVLAKERSLGVYHTQRLPIHAYSLAGPFDSAHGRAVGARIRDHFPEKNIADGA
jgi:hypothetical protein